MAILVVDDSNATRRALRELLQTSGYADVALADSGATALAAIGAAEARSFDLVILDLQMPGIDGIQTCRALKATAEGRDLPVLMLTGVSDPFAIEAAFDAGAVDYIEKPFQPVALLARIRAALALKKEADRRRARERELLAATKRLADLNRELTRRSAEDGLTGLANRGNFDRTLGVEWRRAARRGWPVSLVLVDVDQFKAYNDEHGHLQGDAALRAIASVLRDGARRPADLAARYGGEEFAVLLPDTDGKGASTLAERMRAKVEALNLAVPSGRAPAVTISCGVATLAASPAGDANQLVVAADAALSRAKRAGRNRCSSHPADSTSRPSSSLSTAPPPPPP